MTGSMTILVLGPDGPEDDDERGKGGPGTAFLDEGARSVPHQRRRHSPLTSRSSTAEDDLLRRPEHLPIFE